MGHNLHNGNFSAMFPEQNDNTNRPIDGGSNPAQTNSQHLIQPSQIQSQHNIQQQQFASAPGSRVSFNDMNPVSGSLHQSAYDYNGMSQSQPPHPYNNDPRFMNQGFFGHGMQQQQQMGSGGRDGGSQPSGISTPGNGNPNLMRRQSQIDPALQGSESSLKTSKRQKVSSDTAVSTRARDSDSSDSDVGRDPLLLKLDTMGPEYRRLMKFARWHWSRFWSMDSDDRPNGENADNTTAVIEEMVIRCYGPNTNLKRNRTFRSSAFERVRKWSRDWQRTVLKNFRTHITKQLRTLPGLVQAARNKELFIQTLCAVVNIPTFGTVFTPIFPYLDWEKVFETEEQKSFYVTCYGWFAWIAFEDMYRILDTGEIVPIASDANTEGDTDAAELTLYEKFRLIGQAPDFAALRLSDLPFVTPESSKKAAVKTNPAKKKKAELFIGQIKAYSSGLSPTPPLSITYEQSATGAASGPSRGMLAIAGATAATANSKDGSLDSAMASSSSTGAVVNSEAGGSGGGKGKNKEVAPATEEDARDNGDGRDNDYDNDSEQEQV